MYANELTSYQSKSSKTHLEISSTIKACTFEEFEIEYLIAGGYADICFLNLKKIVEINGPLHYDNEGNLSAHSQFRQRIMEKCGFPVFHIKIKEWDKAKDKNAFIRQFLENANIPTNDNLPNIRITVQNDNPLPPSTIKITIPASMWHSDSLENQDDNEPPSKRRRIESHDTFNIQVNFTNS
jgi:very-short-patch-repair endonuclease